ncbi:uncharacterized protein (DUF58 family) [Conyzicola lurida]|uniref:Uncharacterized protein (DUF58 family) n=1 Tax=Conyzicola lurida TaxID=1172621 RepID=A0A841AK24_9MICO|nr:hypothetical protein [Conyzicola lurida]MBB5842061.1 uncharacterized protein (DUF58 family) [Conyzicola lurida]
MTKNAAAARYPSSWAAFVGISGQIFMALAVLLGAAGLVIYLSGNELALMLIIVGFGVFVSAIGLLTAARGAR